MFRYSILTLLVVVMLVGLFCAALPNPSDLWALAIYLSTVAVFPAAAGLGGVKEMTRPFAFVFAIAGFSYFLLCHVLVAYGTDTILLDLPTTWLLFCLRGWLGQVDSTFELNGLGNFMVIGHCLWALVFATIGGLAATWLQRPPKEQTQETNLNPSN